MKFQLRGVEVKIQGIRQDVPPSIESISYEIVVDTDESDQRLRLLHENVKKYGTVFSMVAPGMELGGVMIRRTQSERPRAACPPDLSLKPSLTDSDDERALRPILSAR